MQNAMDNEILNDCDEIENIWTVYSMVWNDCIDSDEDY